MPKGVVVHAAIKPLALSAGPSSSSTSKVYLLAICCLVFVVVPALILINIKWLQKELGEQQGVEILAATVVVLQFLQFILHHLRFRRSHWLVQWGAWGAYYVPMPLAALAVGEMLRLRRPFWPVAVLFAAGQSDTMAAYSLDDDSQNMRRFAKRTLYLAYLVVALLQQRVDYYSLLAGFLVFLVHLKVSSIAMVSSGDICMAAAEAAASRRCRSAQQGQGELGAVVALGQLESRRSAIAGSTSYEEILTMEYSEKLQDVCLSSALFLQLLQRYHSPYQRIQSSSANTAFRKLPVVAAGDDHSLRVHARALKLVEVQLSLMYDHFFSAHGSPCSASYKLYWDHWVFKIGFLMHTLSLVYLNDVHPQRRQAEAAEHGGALFAIGAVYLLVMLELCQLVHYLTSDRFIVSYMCDRARALSLARRTSSNSACKPLHMVVLNAILETRGISWQTTLGQYSLVEDYSDCTCSCLGQRFMGRLHHHHQRGNPVALSMDQVKAWILEKVVIVTSPEPEPGCSVSSPSSTTESEADEPSRRKKHFPRQLSWTFSQETETHTILTWHIATWICSMRTVHEVLRSSDYMAATRLSSYCAYLVAFHPELLPEHHTVATRIFDNAIREAELHLKGETSPDVRYKKFISAWEQGKLSSQGLLEPAARLARQLKEIDIKRGSSYCWAMIADFWAEMVLHLAQSGNATAHIEHLAKGGEFITRLWALLSNAGIQHNTALTIKRKKIDGRKKVQSKKSSVYQDKIKEKRA